MSPLTKLVWFREQDAKTFAAARKWVGIKDYLFHRLTGEYVIDHSCASGTGLMELSTLDWDAEALAVAGIAADRLPRARADHARRGARRGRRRSARARRRHAGRRGRRRRAAGEPRSRRGPSRRRGAARSGPAERSASSSSSRRSTRAAASSATPSTPGRWIVGGAINNGGVVLQWAEKALTPDFGRARRGRAARARGLGAGRQRRAADAALPAVRARAALERAGARRLRRAHERARPRAPRARCARGGLPAARARAALRRGGGQRGP